MNLKRLANAIITNYGRLDHKITFTQNLRSTTDYVYKHVINTAILCALISAQVYYTPTEQEELVLAALLHDIGRFEQLKMDWDCSDRRSELTAAFAES